MERLKLSAGEFLFLEKEANYFDLDSSLAFHRVRVRVFGEVPIKVYANYVDDNGQVQAVMLGQGIRYEQELELEGFESVSVVVPKGKTAMVSLTRTGRAAGEVLDPTPIALADATSRQVPLSQLVRMEIRKYLQAAGQDPADADQLDLDPLDGDFEDDGADDFDLGDGYADDDELFEHDGEGSDPGDGEGQEKESASGAGDENQPEGDQPPAGGTTP